MIAEYWLAAKEHKKARAALLDSADKSCKLHAYSDAAKAASQALEIWPDGEDEEKRLGALERMAHCAQISGQLSEAAKSWREVLESPVIQEDYARSGEAWRALAIVYGLQGFWEQCLSARTQQRHLRNRSNQGKLRSNGWQLQADTPHCYRMTLQSSCVTRPQSWVTRQINWMFRHVLTA